MSVDPKEALVDVPPIEDEAIGPDLLLTPVHASLLTPEGITSSTPQRHLSDRLAEARVAPPLYGAKVKGTLIRRDDVEELCQHAETFLNRFASPIRMPPAEFEGPDHSRYRKIMDPLFSPKNVERWRPDMVRIGNDLIDKFIERGECDFSNEFAFWMPATLFLRLMGVPREDLHIVMPPQRRLTSSDQLEISEQRIAERLAYSQRIYAYIEEALNERIKERRDDILSALLNSELDGDRLTHDEVLAMAHMLFSAGFDTVFGTLETFFAYLATHPEQRRLLVDRPELISSAVEEMLRYETPVETLSRIAGEDAEIGGMEVHRGDKIAFSLHAANLDSARFPDPHNVDFERDPNPHIAFGAGIHRCAGSHLARVELRTTLTEWHKRIPDYWVAEGTEPGFVNGIVRHVNLQLQFPPGGGPAPR